MIRRALVNRKNISFVAWVAIGTGSVFLSLALPLPALGAFVVGACCAYAGRSGRRQSGHPVAGLLERKQPEVVDDVNQQAPAMKSTREASETEDEAATR
ncbi:hypothetical protein QF001_003524 [Paraburkholderia youngii]|uniref:Uncharacterized protein n=1 Tax=Paraburkholderia youngii TaxID=2782701 RepID=A0A7Y6K5S7_9BURK|nr:hypothetical protein [Paraburkholderia youngii]NUY04946.1 hypothetical protein [Paraburkholderia youngii]